VKAWEQPLVQLVGGFLLLGLFAWWTFQIISLPPVLRNLFEEDQAIGRAAGSIPEEDLFQQELNRLPAPSENHAPEVSALLQRLQALAPIPYVLQIALQRDAATPPREDRPPWSETELRALASAQAALREAWFPFLSGAEPDWKRFPDSTALFRFQGDFLSTDWRTLADLVNLRPGQPQDRDSLGDPEFTLAYLRQIRKAGSIHWNETDVVYAAARRVKIVETQVLPADFPLESLIAIRDGLGPAPTLEDLRAGLEADRALFIRIARYLESLPGETTAAAGLARWLGNKVEGGWILQESGNFSRAQELAADLNRKAFELDSLLQKTFLTAPAWHQWLAGNPEVGLSLLLVRGLAGLRYFEETRTEFIVTQAALEVRLALEAGGMAEARRIPDPLRPGLFFQLQETESEFRTFCSYIPPKADQPASFRLPDSLRPNLNPEAEKISPDAQDR